MAGKRALIVDDSRAARAFLARMLEGHALEVDTVESAEEAIEFLGRHHPDVIFMDHLMPGMDGFQAVQAIKNDPRTATIPIMMYTSQEGELYLGQARALGAIGVMPKQIKPADVSKVLYQLRLVPDRRSADRSSVRHPDEIERRAPPDAFDVSPTAETAVVQAQSTGSNASTGTVERLNLTAEAAIAGGASPAVVNETLVRDQIAELRRFVVANLEQHTERVLGEVRERAAEIQAATSAPPPVLQMPPALPERVSPSPTLAWAAALAGLAFGVIFLVLWRQEAGERAGLEMQLAAVPPRVIEPDVGDASAIPPTAAGAPADASPAETADSLVVEPVPYGEIPLGGGRVERVRSIVTPLIARGFRGSVHVSAFPGRFCVEGNASEGYSLAPEDMRFSTCDAVGSGSEIGSAPQLESLAFANMVSDLRKRANGAFEIAVDAGAPDALSQPYPRNSASLTAGEWNRAAAANNRVEVRLQGRQ